ncbi:hypothetical protein R84B8_02090 [Treponema sp. R8-4-B8]
MTAAHFIHLVKLYGAGTCSIFHLHPAGAVIGSPVRPFNWVNKQVNNRRFLTEKKFAINKIWHFLGAHAPPCKKNPLPHKRKKMLNKDKIALLLGILTEFNVINDCDFVRKFVSFFSS